MLLVDQVFGKASAKAESRRKLIHEAITEKNWMWHNDIKIPNGVHAYGRRYNPFGPDNYPAEIQKIRELTAIRDRAVWLAASKGERLDLSVADKNTTPLPAVKTNYNPEKNGSLTYLSGKEALAKLNVPPGYKIELFASEDEFPDLAKPCKCRSTEKVDYGLPACRVIRTTSRAIPNPTIKLLFWRTRTTTGKRIKKRIC